MELKAAYACDIDDMACVAYGLNNSEVHVSGRRQRARTVAPHHTP